MATAAQMSRRQDSHVIVALRADASVQQGTGHVMRCLTLAEALAAAGHEVHLVTAGIEIPWLRNAVDSSPVLVHRCARDTSGEPVIRALGATWIVVDSYRIEPDAIAVLRELAPVLAIVDGTDRGIAADIYLEQNLGAETRFEPSARGAIVLAGSRFALIRKQVIGVRAPEPWRISGTPEVLSFMGGTDPTAASVPAAAALAPIVAKSAAALRLIAPSSLHDRIRMATRGERGVSVIGTTTDLPSEFARADVVVSAAGTSAWELAALGMPSVLLAVADNQLQSLSAATEMGIALGVNALDPSTEPFLLVAQHVRALLASEDLRRSLSHAALAAFDGLGAARVVDTMVRLR